MITHRVKGLQIQTHLGFSSGEGMMCFNASEMRCRYRYTPVLSLGPLPGGAASRPFPYFPTVAPDAPSRPLIPVPLGLSKTLSRGRSCWETEMKSLQV